MTAEAGWFKTSRDGDCLVVETGGRWNVRTVEALEGKLRKIGAEARTGKPTTRARIDMAGGRPGAGAAG